MNTIKISIDYHSEDDLVVTHHETTMSFSVMRSFMMHLSDKHLRDYPNENQGCAATKIHDLIRRAQNDITSEEASTPR